MSYSALLYSNTRKLLQFQFLLPCWKFSWWCESVLTLYNRVVTSRNLRLDFRQLYIIRTMCIRELCIIIRTMCIRELCITLKTRGIISLYSHKWVNFITETECVSFMAWYRPLNTKQVNVIKEVDSFGAWRLVLGKMDTNVSEESLSPVFSWKRGWKEQVTANYRVSQQTRQSGFSFYCFRSFENVTFKSIHTYIHLKKMFLTLHHISMIFTV
jgi:hypothetical protein